MKATVPPFKKLDTGSDVTVEFFVRSDKDTRHAFSGTFNLTTMTVTCEKENREWKLPAFEKHAGLKPNSWHSALMVSPGETLGEWITSQDSSKSRIITPKQRWQQQSKALPQGWTAEATKKSGTYYKRKCTECGKTASIESKAAMEKFLAKQKHCLQCSSVTADQFIWDTAKSSTPANGTSATEQQAGSSMHKDKKPPGNGKTDTSKHVKTEKSAFAEPTSPGAEPSCKQCGTTSTPQWRNGKTMCNACYLRERKDKMLSKRRATAPAGIQVILDESGNPMPASSGPEKSPPRPLPTGQAAGASGNPPLFPWPIGPPGEAGGMRANGALQHLAAASMGPRGLKFRRTDSGSAPAGPMGLPPMFGGSIGGMPGSAFGFVQPSSSGSGYGMRMPPLRPHASAGPPGSPDTKPAFAAEESVLRSMSLMDASVAEALAACTKNFAAQRCAARDKGYESTKRSMRRRVSKMLDDGDDGRDESQEDILKSLQAETADNKHAEADLIASLKTFCGKLVRNWSLSQGCTVREAFQEGQSIARDDFTKHLYECLN